MSKRDWRLFVKDILDAIKRIHSYTKDMGLAVFLNDEKTKDAVVRNLEIIGEAAGKIPEDVRKRNPHIPWSQIVGLRNRLIHGYFVIDYEIVWHIIQNELPQLQQELEFLYSQISISETNNDKEGKADEES